MKRASRASLAAARLTTALLLAAVCGGSPSLASQAKTEGQPIAGLWILNEKESQMRPEPPPGENADRRRPPDDDPAGGPPPGGGGGGMGGFGGFGGRPGGRPDESKMNQRRSLLALHRQPTPRLTFVFRPDRAIVLTDAEGHVRTLLADGKKYREPLPEGGAADRITKWRDGVLTSELRGDGIKLFSSFQVDESGDRLIVVQTLDVSGADDGKVSLQRVYDRGDLALPPTPVSP